MLAVATLGAMARGVAAAAEVRRRGEEPCRRRLSTHGPLAHRMQRAARPTVEPREKGAAACGAGEERRFECKWQRGRAPRRLQDRVHCSDAAATCGEQSVRAWRRCVLGRLSARVVCRRRPRPRPHGRLLLLLLLLLMLWLLLLLLLLHGSLHPCAPQGGLCDRGTRWARSTRTTAGRQCLDRRAAGHERWVVPLLLLLLMRRWQRRAGADNHGQWLRLAGVPGGRRTVTALLLAHEHVQKVLAPCARVHCRLDRGTGRHGRHRGRPLGRRWVGSVGGEAGRPDAHPGFFYQPLGRLPARSL